MPLPQFFQRFRSGAHAPVHQAAPASPADMEQARVKARRRMIGMAVLVGAGVIGFPWLFETEPRPLSPEVQVVNATAPATAKVAAPAVPPVVRRALEAQSSVTAGTVDQEPREEVLSDEPATSGQDVRPAPSAEPKPKPDPQPEPKPAVKPDPQQETRPKAEPKPVQKAPSRAEQGADARAAALLNDDNTRYIVQVGAFSDSASAQAARMKVERLGIRTYVQAVDTPAGKKVRVRVGPYVNKADAEKAMATLKKAGLTGALLTL